jgi:hypothetical protein
MPSFSAVWVFTVLGPLFLVLAAWRGLRPGPSSQARTWLTIGLIFSAVAAWLWWNSAAPH